MTDNCTITDLREGHGTFQTAHGDRIAVIVRTPYTKRKANLGVQFWTLEMIQKGQAVNTDGSISSFVEAY